MQPGPTRVPVRAGTRTHAAPQVIVAEPCWRKLIAHAEIITSRAVRVVGVDATVLLASDHAVRQLNSRHRGLNKPTNVLTFAPARDGLPGDIVLALGTVAREAAASGRRPAHHLAHLVVHGALHLQGHDHQQAGEARRMEMAETRLLRRIGVPNPWASK